PDHVVVSIVAIHGLDGHAMTSWTAANDTLWLRDLLPKRIPRARILTYGYNAYTRGNKLANESIYSIGQKLLADLATDRDGSNIQQRPIIFVAHSLGGIVLKDTLIHADKHEYASYKAIERSTYGILFLGTPHQGTAAVDLATLILRILPVGSNIILSDLGLQNKVLQQQQDQYNQIGPRYATKCYYEMHPTELPLGKMKLVDRPNAILPETINSQSLGLYRDHVDICKFGDHTEQDFKTVFFHLSEMVVAAPSKITKIWEEHEKLQGL
ncbi:hypothetical protein L208DRAFT_1262445, partial [Tricholoma matsutake]